MVQIPKFFGAIFYCFALLFLFSSSHNSWATLIMKGLYDVEPRGGAPILLQTKTLTYILTDHSLKCVQTDEQTVIWQRNFTDKHNVFGTLAVEGDRLFLAYDNGRIMTFSTKDGRLLWHKKWPQALMRSTLSVREGHLFFATLDNTIICLSSRDGKFLWQYKGTVLMDESLSDLVDIDMPHRGLVSENAFFYPDPTGKLVALHVTDGRVLWTQVVSNTEASFGSLNLVKQVAGPIFVYGSGRDQNQHRDLIITISRVGPMEARDAQTGKLVWRLKVSGIQRPLNYKNSLLYVISRKGNLLAVDAQTGQKKWARNINDLLPEAYRADFWYGPTLLKRKDTISLILASNSGTLVQLDPTREGMVQAYYDIRYPAARPAVVFNRMVSVLTENGNLLLLEAED